MNHIDLFSGIGGFSLAASWAWGKDHNIVCFVEKDKFCQKVLNKHWPKVPIVEDIKNAEEIKKHADIFKHINLITGGFPCQPFSVAGKQGGKRDDRYLWPEMLKVIQIIRPSWIIGENVPGIISMELDTVLSDLESEGYTTGTVIVPACAVDAPHRRDRVWIVGNTECSGCNGKAISILTGRQDQEGADTAGAGCGCRDFWDEDPACTCGSNIPFHCYKHCSGLPKGSIFKCGLGGNSDGLPPRLDGNPWGEGWEDGVPMVATKVRDRVDRLKSLGNAIVPQVAYQLMNFIKEIENNSNQ